MRKQRNHIEDLRGVGRLAVEATRGVTDLVQAMHLNIAAGPDILGRPLAAATRLLTAPIYESIRRTTGLVGGAIDAALGALDPLIRESDPAPEREAVLSALNGVLGDYLSERENPLAITMELMHDGHSLDLAGGDLAMLLPQAGRKLLVLVHGLCANERCWSRRGHDHGSALARDLGYTPVYLRYNSGLHISKNGRMLAELLERLVVEWPMYLDELVIIAHSMGGLVARSACHYGESAGHAWRKQLSTLVCLGSPHHGAPLERGGAWADLLLGISRYSEPMARLGRIRSAGITDMRFGNVLDEHWVGRDRFRGPVDDRTPLPLPSGVECCAIAASTASEPGPVLPGDGLVPVDSALGRHENPQLTLAFPETRQRVCLRMGHLDLLDAPEVYAALQAWLAS